MSMHLVSAIGKQNAVDSEQITLDAFIRSLHLVHIARNPILPDPTPDELAIKHFRKRSDLGGILQVVDGLGKSPLAPRQSSGVDSLNRITADADAASLESISIKENAALYEPLLLTMKLHDNAFAIGCTPIRFFVFCLPEEYAKEKGDKTHADAGIAISLSHVKHTFGTFVTPANQTVEVGSSPSSSSPAAIETLRTSPAPEITVEDEDMNEIAKELSDMDDYHQKTTDFSLEIFFRIPKTYVLGENPDLPPVCIRVNTIQANEKFLVLNCVQVDAKKLNYERANNEFNLEKERVAKANQSANQKQGFFSKLVGAQPKSHIVTMKKPVPPARETRVTYRISCWSKKEAYLAAKLLNSYQDTLNDITS